MLNTQKTTDENNRKAIAQIARTVEEILQRVTDANMKLDHIIETYHHDRYAPEASESDDPFNGYHPL